MYWYVSKKVKNMLNELQTADKAVGYKQSVKRIRDGEAKKAFIAENAAPEITDKVIRACEENNVAYEWISSMEELGRACKIDVGAAVAVVY